VARTKVVRTKVVRTKVVRTKVVRTKVVRTKVVRTKVVRTNSFCRERRMYVNLCLSFQLVVFDFSADSPKTLLTFVSGRRTAGPGKISKGHISYQLNLTWIW
jgi:hypothetical protein